MAIKFLELEVSWCIFSNRENFLRLNIFYESFSVEKVIYEKEYTVCVISTLNAHQQVPYTKEHFYINFTKGCGRVRIRHNFFLLSMVVLNHLSIMKH